MNTARVLLLPALLGLFAVSAVAAPPLKDMLPGKAVLSPAELDEFAQPQRASVQYSGPPRVDFPVLPLQVFGLRYAVDIVLVSRDTGWDMHEYARIDLPSGPLWLAKDTDEERVQWITADLPDIETLLPEVPTPRVSSPVQVTDHSQGDRVDVALAYTNPRGQKVEVEYRHRMSRRPPGKRNGSTMGHSRQMAAVVLDLARFGHGGRVRFRLDGQEPGLDHLLGVYPQKYLLDQTQGGVTITDFRQQPADSGFLLRRPGEPRDWPTRALEPWTLSTDAAGLTLAQSDNGITALRYAFLDGGLTWAEVRQQGEPNPVFRMRFNPALPDLRRPFEGRVESRFTLDPHDQAGHGTGTVTCWWEGPDTVRVAFTPTEPRWLADRPMMGSLRYLEDGSVAVEMHRQDPAP